MCWSLARAPLCDILEQGTGWGQAALLLLQLYSHDRQSSFPTIQTRWLLVLFRALRRGKLRAYFSWQLYSRLCLCCPALRICSMVLQLSPAVARHFCLL